MSDSWSQENRPWRPDHRNPRYTCPVAMLHPSDSDLNAEIQSRTDAILAREGGCREYRTMGLSQPLRPGGYKRRRR